MTKEGLLLLLRISGALADQVIPPATSEIKDLVQGAGRTPTGRRFMEDSAERLQVADLKPPTGSSHRVAHMYVRFREVWTTKIRKKAPRKCRPELVDLIPTAFDQLDHV